LVPAEPDKVVRNMSIGRPPFFGTSCWPSGLSKMPLYLFNLVGPDGAYNLEGAFLKDEADARSVAWSLADELKPKIKTDNYQLVIENDRGAEVDRIPIKPAAV
jgi:hypothetical protein